MLNKIAKLAVKVSVKKELPVTFLNSRLFAKYSCASEQSRITYQQLIDHLNDAVILQGGKSIRDALNKETPRLQTSEGLFYHKLAGIPIFVNIYIRQVRESPRECADIYIPMNFKDRWELAVPELFPYSSSPMHFQIKHTNREWALDNDIVSATAIGEFMIEYAQEKPLVEEEIYQKLNSVFKRFVEDPDYYKSKKKVRRETIMMYGPPGTGKTSLVRHFISVYKTHFIEYIPTMSGTHLIKLLGQLNGAPAVVLVEDIDSFLFLLTNIAKRLRNNPKYQPEEGSEDEPVDNSPPPERRNYSEFINLLDGLVPLKNCIFIFTTNNPEQLRSSIYRMGRVNHLLEVNYPEIETVRKFLGLRKVDKRWKYLMGLDDQRLPLDAIYQIKDAKTVDEMKNIIASRDITLTLKDKRSYE